MEGITNPYSSDLEVDFLIYTEEIFCSSSGSRFIRFEHRGFDLETKIKELDSIIISVLKKMQDIKYDNKKDIVNNINIKHNLLKNLLKKFKEIKQRYNEYDEYYQNLIETYGKEYNNISIFDFCQRRKYIELSIHVQKLLVDKFSEFCNDYYIIRNEFFESNNYIIKIKKLFNIELK